jgi:hypothetical protein
LREYPPAGPNVRRTAMFSDHFKTKQGIKYFYGDAAAD